MKNWTSSRDAILAAPLPSYSDGKYTAIPHSIFLDELQEKLDTKGYKVEEERYLTLSDCKVISGTFKVSSDLDTEMSPSVMFTNSYNKTRKASVMAAAMVLVCRNGACGLAENGSYIRKHTGNALEDFRNHLSLVVDGLEKEFERLIKNKEEMKLIEVDKITRAKLIGDMFMNEKMINTTQLSIIQRETEGSQHFKDNSLWSFYNHVTEAYKDNHPMTYDKSHIKLHTYISDKFNLTGARGLFKDGLILN